MPSLKSGLHVAFVLLAALTVGITGGTAQAQTSPAMPGTFASLPTYSADGQASVVFMGGTVDQLDLAARAVCASGVWAQENDGTYQLLVVGGPAFLKDGFNRRFTSGFVGATAVTLTKSVTTCTPTATPASNRFDIAHADAIAHSALLQPADLPGGTWSVTFLDAWSQGSYRDIPECAATHVADAAHDAAWLTGYAGRANSELSLATATVQAIASEMVVISPNGTSAQTAVSTFGNLYTAPDFERCIEASGTANGVTTRVTKATPRAVAPNGGLAYAWDVVTTSGSVSLTTRLETVAWQSSNAYVELRFFGPTTNVTAQLLAAAVSKVQARLAASATP